jgi:hypothetical protein
LFLLPYFKKRKTISHNGRAMGVACGNTRLAYAHDALALVGCRTASFLIDQRVFD